MDAFCWLTNRQRAQAETLCEARTGSWEKSVSGWRCCWSHACWILEVR